MKEIKLSEIVKFAYPEYVYLKITPNNGIRNQSTDRIAKTITLLYANVLQAIRVEDSKVINFFGRESLFHTKYSINPQTKVTYYIYLEKSKVEFYFIVPKQYLSLMTERIRDTWTNLTILEVKEIPRVSEEAINYQLTYKHEDGLSLETDKRNNDIISSNLNLLNVLQEGDKVAIIYNFMPTTQYGWQSQYKATLTRVKRKETTIKNKMSLSFLVKFLINAICSTLDFIADPFVSNESRNQKKDDTRLTETLLKLNNRTDISTSTEGKANQKVINTQIILQSDSEDKVRKYNNIRGLAQSYDIISNDNSLIPSKIKSINSLESFSLTKSYNKMSTSECSNFISLPGRDLLETYQCIEKVDTTESSIPEDLAKGSMYIGDVTYQGKSQRAHLSTDPEYQYLSLCVIGPSRAGKSNLIGHLAINAIDNKECVIIFDFCGNCELSQTISANINKKKVLEIDCSNFKTLQGLGYNEIRATDNIFEQYRNAKEQANQLLVLINTVNEKDKELAPRMERYLLASAIIVFMCNGAIKDVFDLLQNHSIRSNYMDKIPEDQFDNLNEYMLTLFELDEIKDDKVVGTQYSKISGIIDRLHKLKKNSYIELMLKKDCKQNFDLVSEIQKNQLICLKMPEIMFMTDEERDIYCTYWMTKIWLSLQIRKWEIPERKNHTKVNIIIDELYQVNNTEVYLKERLARLAKFSAKPIISCHYINQMKSLREELRSANSSYILVSGCDTKNYSELKTELQPFTEEDLLKLKRFHSLNYIKCKNGYGRFIAKLPPELPNNV